MSRLSLGFCAIFLAAVLAAAPVTAWGIEDGLPTEEVLHQWAARADQLASELLGGASCPESQPRCTKSRRNCRSKGWFAKGVRGVGKKVRKISRQLRRKLGCKHPTTKPKKQRSPSFNFEELAGMKVRKLKNLLRRAEVGYNGVVEKRELVEKACIATPGCHIPKAHNRHEPTQTQKSDDSKASESQLVSQILRKLHSKVQQLETDMIQHRMETQLTIDAIRTNFSQQLFPTTNPHTAGNNQGEADGGSNGLPLPLWESDSSDYLWVLWVLIRLIMMLAALFLVNLFVWKVLILLFTRISAAVQQPAGQVTPPARSNVSTPTPTQAVNGQNVTFPPEAMAKSQPSTGADKERCVKGMSVEEQPLLSQLESMGFGNKACILKALEDANGDVSAAALALAS